MEQRRDEKIHEPAPEGKGAVAGCTCGRCSPDQAPERRCLGAYQAATPKAMRRGHVLARLKAAARTSSRHAEEYAEAVAAYEDFLLRSEADL